MVSSRPSAMKRALRMITDTLCTFFWKSRTVDTHSLPSTCLQQAHPDLRHLRLHMATMMCRADICNLGLGTYVCMLVSAPWGPDRAHADHLRPFLASKPLSFKVIAAGAVLSNRPPLPEPVPCQITRSSGFMPRPMQVVCTQMWFCAVAGWPPQCG